jgi:hypothetical protein
MNHRQQVISACPELLFDLLDWESFACTLFNYRQPARLMAGNFRQAGAEISVVQDKGPLCSERAKGRVDRSGTGGRQNERSTAGSIDGAPIDIHPKIAIVRQVRPEQLLQDPGVHVAGSGQRKLIVAH